MNVPTAAAIALAAATAGVGTFWCRPALTTSPALRPDGYGAVPLGMPRVEAVRAGGPGAMLAPLCGQAEGLIFHTNEPSLAARPAEPLPVMVMFSGGHVSEVDLGLDGLAGTPAAHSDCLSRAATAATSLTAAYGPPEAKDVNGDTSLLRERRTRFRLPGGGTAEVISRWYAGDSGRCFTHARWTALGVAPVIP